MSVMEQSVGIIVLRETPQGTQVCLVQHAAGHWGFPKGHQDPGETHEQTARRELKEETGIADVRIIPGEAFTEQYEFDRDGERVQKTVTYLVGYSDTEALAPALGFAAEIRDVRWFSLTEAQEQVTFPESKALVGQVEALIARGS